MGIKATATIKLFKCLKEKQNSIQTPVTKTQQEQSKKDSPAPVRPSGDLTTSRGSSAQYPATGGLFLFLCLCYFRIFLFPFLHCGFSGKTCHFLFRFKTDA
jgi:hypothetical protein